MSISIKDISKFYDDQAALKSVSLEVKKGEIVGFLGPNGAETEVTTLVNLFSFSSEKLRIKRIRIV